MKKFKITKGNKVYIVDAKSHIDAINKVKSIKDSGIIYGTLFIDLNSPNELTASKIVQEVKNEIGNNKIAEIRGGSFTPVSEHSNGRLDLDFKEFKNNEWGTNHITLTVRPSLPFIMKTMKDDPKSEYKLRAELNNKLKQFANKTIYTNRSFTMDSKIKDIDEYKKNYASAMRAAGEKTKRDQINSDIQKLYDIAKQYGPVRTEQNKLNNEFEQQNMQVVRNRFYNDPTVKRALKQMEDLDKKWDAIIHKYPKLVYEYAIDDEGPNRFMGFNTPTKKWVDDIKKQLIKDSAIKDMPLMFKSNVNMQSLKSNIDNVKNKPNETYINSLNANIQGIIADIEEIKGYEKEGKFNESPALKLSCKNLTAQYYKLLNDPKLQGIIHKLDTPTYKNVLYAEHQAQMLSQVTLKDSSIKDSYWPYIMAPMRTPGDKDLDLLSKLMSSYYDTIYQDVYNIRKAFAKTTNKRVAINMAKDMPEYAKFIRTLDSVDKDWNAVISKYPRLKKFYINTTGAERLLYGYYPTTKDYVDEIIPVIKKEW